MKITRNRELDLAYITFSDRPIARTLEASEDVYFDLDAAGQLVGVELLRASAYLDQDTLNINEVVKILEDEPVKPELVFG